MHQVCSYVCDIVYMVEYTPVRTPGDSRDKANIREKDSIIFDAIQGIMHLTEWQSVQLELELHLADTTESLFINTIVYIHPCQEIIQNFKTKIKIIPFNSFIKVFVCIFWFKACAHDSLS